MQVNAEIHLGTRSVLEYLLSPVQKLAHQAGRELWYGQCSQCDSYRPTADIHSRAKLGIWGRGIILFASPRSAGIPIVRA